MEVCHDKPMPQHKHHKIADEPKSEATPTSVTIDGIEGEKVRVELPDGSTADWDIASLPTGVKEGDVVQVKGKGEHQTFEIDHQETAQRKDKAQTDLDALNQHIPKGEIDL